MNLSPSTILRHANVSALLVTNESNIRYLTNIACSDGSVLVTPRSMRLFVDGRYLETAKKGSYDHIQVRESESFDATLKRYKEVGIEANTVTLREKAYYKTISKNTKLVHTTNVIEHFRRTKRPDELQLLRKADSITRAMLQKIPAVLKLGIREIDIAWMLRSWAHELGAEDLSFDSIVAFGPNSSSPHHHSGTRRLRKRDIVLIDCGARYKGYCGDRTEMFFVGKPTTDQTRALEAVQKANDSATALVKAGASTCKIDEAAREVLKEYGMEDAFSHALGHGVGLDIHEGVSLSHKGKDWKLQENEVITIEPGVYFPGKFGIRLEDMVFVV